MRGARTVLFHPLSFVESSADLNVVPNDVVRVRRIAAAEVDTLVRNREKADGFVRARQDRDFYTPRLKSLAGSTVVDVRLKGKPDTVRSELLRLAQNAEHALIVGAWIHLGWKKLRNHLADPVLRGGSELVVGPGWKMRSSRLAGRQPNPLRVTDAFVTRSATQPVWLFARSACETTGWRVRLETSLRWLAEAAKDQNRVSAVVKLCTAFESLLTGGREGVTRALSERSAFLLSTEPSRRAATSTAVKRIYDLRSASVHGSSGSEETVAAEWLNAACRLVLAVAGVICANLGRWNHHGGLVQWVEQARWGVTSPELSRPHSWRSIGPATKRLVGRA